ncbi:MAG: hypothetical protein WB581_00435 [Halobacteriota archaeon]
MILKEYPKEEIIQFFKSVVNPALKDRDAEPKERGRETDLQIHDDPGHPISWLDNRLINNFHAKAERGRRKFRYSIWAEPASSSGGYIVKRIIWRHGPCGTYRGGRGPSQEDRYPRDINEISKEDIFKDIKKLYNGFL